VTDQAAALPHSPWRPPSDERPTGGDLLPVAIEALRRLQNTITGSGPDDAVWGDVARRLDEVSAMLAEHPVPESLQVVGHRVDIPGRAQAMSPPLYVDEWDDEHVSARVTFGRFYLGGNGAVHGGAIPLLFDEVLGRLANTGRPRSRTAYLHVDYRAITPIERELVVSGRVDRIEGRKRFLRSELRDGDVLVAEAEGLFVALNPGQP
jgi:acyl-coenzyme A thioesterase PaaI-like protein